eukprot:scaffold5039_cov119-Cylindrotheca_fusiformis.AAC.5
MRIVLLVCQLVWLASSIAVDAAATTCESSKDCGKSEYCADGECLEAGACKVEVDCFNPENNFPAIDCIGYLQCDQNMCGKICSTEDQPSSCKPSIEEVNCFVDPCQVADCEEATACVSNYCGGCNAIHFNAQGTQVCVDEMEIVDELKDEVPGDSRMCESSKDCAGDSEYCADGECLTTGSCKIEEDCYNPENEFATDGCLGYLECQDSMCIKECSPGEQGNDCKPGEFNVPCAADPCEVFACKDAIACVPNTCGGCVALQFDAKGSLVCTDGTGNGSDVQTCESSQDCSGRDEYCADGECLAAGSCKIEADCHNPQNVFATDDCLGYLECQEDSCTKVCSPPEQGNNCRPGEYPTPCYADLCKEIECDEAVACVGLACGGCRALFFDAKGSLICTDEGDDGGHGGGGDEQTCESSDDCTGDEQYCAEGMCLKHGSCNVATDCLNPDNDFMAEECVGYMECYDNTCGTICSTEDPPKNCRPGQTEVNCAKDPCEESECDEATSCVSDYCGGCNAIHFNARGGRVCNRLSPIPCTTNKDCISDAAEVKEGETPYCAAGVCLDPGMCNTDEDCINPSNWYPSIACVGPTICSKEGTCSRDCGTGSMCEDGVPMVKCFENPCNTAAAQACNASVACIADFCGGCNANHFDAAGNLVCQDDEDDKKSILPSTCTKDEDCRVSTQIERSASQAGFDDAFCAQGTCLPAGMCNTQLDCLNPSNVYGKVECVGQIICGEDGMCGVECTGEACDGGLEYNANCSACKELGADAISCFEDKCGACKAIQLDSAGNVVGGDGGDGNDEEEDEDSAPSSFVPTMGLLVILTVTVFAQTIL